MMRLLGVQMAIVLSAFSATAQTAVIESPITQEVLPLETDDPEVIGVQTDGTEDISTEPETEPEYDFDFDFNAPVGGELGSIIQEVEIEEASIAEKGVLLRALDKISGEVVDFELTPDQTKQLGRIQVTLGECRFPVGNPAGDASAYLTIRNAGEDPAVFVGWMIASSPALNGLDHSRYDVWVLRCITP